MCMLRYAMLRYAMLCFATSTLSIPKLRYGYALLRLLRLATLCYAGLRYAMLR